MARPQKFTDDDIINALRESKGLVYVAAMKLKCDPDTIHKRARKSKPVAAVIEQERGLLLDTAELAIMQALTRGDLRAAEFILRTLGKGRGYVERQETVTEEPVRVVVQEIVVEKGNRPKSKPEPEPETQP